jgi:hypothetical protein
MIAKVAAALAHSLFTVSLSLLSSWIFVFVLLSFTVSLSAVLGISPFSMIAKAAA